MQHKQEFHRACEVGDLKHTIRSNHFECFKLLIDKVGSFSRSNLMETEFYLTCECGRFEMFKLLCIYIIIPNQEQLPEHFMDHALGFATWGGNLEICECIMKFPGIDPSFLKNNALKNASKRGHLDICKLLLKDKRVYPDGDDNFEALNLAIRENHIEIIRLLTPMVSFMENEQHFEPLVIALGLQRSYEIINILLRIPRAKKVKFFITQYYMEYRVKNILLDSRLRMKEVYYLPLPVHVCDYINFFNEPYNDEEIAIFGRWIENIRVKKLLQIIIY